MSCSFPFLLKKPTILILPNRQKTCVKWLNILLVHLILYVNSHSMRHRPYFEPLRESNFISYPMFDLIFADDIAIRIDIIFPSIVSSEEKHLSSIIKSKLHFIGISFFTSFNTFNVYKHWSATFKPITTKHFFIRVQIFYEVLL